MRVLVSGICGFVGSELALGLRRAGHEICGFDNFSRPGSQLNQPRLEAAGIEFWRGDVRHEADLDRARGIDWLVDAAANPSANSEPTKPQIPLTRTRMIRDYSRPGRKVSR